MTRQMVIQEQTISKNLKRNAIVTATCALAGFSMLIPAFSTEGRKFDYQEFCFKPNSVPAGVTWCKGKRLKKGVAWKVALEAENSAEFKAKVTFLKYLPAQNPNAGLFGVCGAGFFFAGFLLFMGGTNELEDNLDLAVWNKKAIVLERAFASEQHISIESLRNEQEKEFITDMMSRSHGEAMYSLTNEGEREIASAQYKKESQLDQAGFDLQIATLAAQSAEQAEKEAKHKAEAAKLNKSAKSKSVIDTSCPDEAAKQELIEKLKEHEGGWLHTLCTTRKVLIIEGEQGSFKSYTAAMIAYLRYYLHRHKLGWIVDSDYHQNKGKAWKILQGLEVEAYGANKNGASIKEGIERFLEGIKIRDEDNFEVETVIFDELTTYGDYEECQEVAKSFMKFALSAPRKANYGLIAITHSLTNEGTGKGGGMAEARKRGTLHLLLNADNDYNPTFQGTLNGLKDSSGQLVEDMTVTLPEWFRPDQIFIASEV